MNTIAQEEASHYKEEMKEYTVARRKTTPFAANCTNHSLSSLSKQIARKKNKRRPPPSNQTIANDVLSQRKECFVVFI